MLCLELFVGVLPISSMRVLRSYKLCLELCLLGSYSISQLYTCDEIVDAVFGIAPWCPISQLSIRLLRSCMLCLELLIGVLSRSSLYAC